MTVVIKFGPVAGVHSITGGSAFHTCAVGCTDAGDHLISDAVKELFAVNDLDSTESFFQSVCDLRGDRIEFIE
jgi:hypothetical protein